MKNISNEIDLFTSEDQILQNALRTSRKKEYENNPLLDEFNLLTHNYEKILREYKKIVKISDKFEKNLKRTMHELKKANELKTHLMSMAAHDLKNPLSNVIGFSEFLLKKTPINEKQQEILKHIHQASDKMCHLIKELLEDAKIESGNIKPRRQALDLNILIQNIISGFKLQLEQKNQTIFFVKENEVHYIINGDKFLITEIISNLISNAIKYSDFDKSITVCIKKKKARYSYAPRVVIEVKDEGPGFTNCDLKNIFQRFKRLSARPTNNESSTGLGLYITKKLVEIHEGSIGVVSQTGVGTSFIIEFPEYKLLKTSL